MNRYDNAFLMTFKSSGVSVCVRQPGNADTPAQ